MTRSGNLTAKVQAFNYPGVSIVCGLLSYIPFLGGGFFCLAPGIAERSIKKVVIGALLGVGLHAAVLLAFMEFLTWEPRTGYNEIISTYYPPGYAVMTHSGSPLSSGWYVSLASGAWSIAVGLVVLRLSSSELPWSSIRRRIGLGLLVQQALLLATWITAPMDHWWAYGAAPFGDLPDIAFFYVFLTSIPAYSIVITWGLDGRVGRVRSEPTEGEPTE